MRRAVNRAPHLALLGKKISLIDRLPSSGVSYD